MWRPLGSMCPCRSRPSFMRPPSRSPKLADSPSSESHSSPSSTAEWIEGEVKVNCEECGAPVYWKPALQGLGCEHCGAVRKVPRLPGQILERPMAAGRQMLASAPTQGTGLQTKAMRCDNCGARVVQREVAKHCAFCGSAHVLPDSEHRSAIRPESLIPLMLPREQVAVAFQKWLGKLWFRPNALKQLSVFDAIGLYVPSWTFDAHARSSWTAQAGYYYYVTQTYTVTVNGKRQTRTRQVRKVRWKNASGNRADTFDDLQVMASKGVDRELAIKLGSYDTSALVPYRPEYLVGWEAEEYAIDLENGWLLGEQDMRRTQESRCSSDVPGDTQRNLRVDTQLSEVRWKHVLLPLWSLTFRFAGKPYAVLINGQSGRIVGRAPYSWVKILLVVLAVLAACGIGFFIAEA